MHRKTAKEIQTAFLDGQVSATQIVNAVLKDIEDQDKKLNAFLRLFNERALKKAEEIDIKRSSKKPLGKLAGVPIALKDNIVLKGEITSCGSKFLSNYRSPYQATVVRLLEEEDAIIVGKTNMDEFAMGASGIHSAFGATKNPWNLQCSPGGSSSGSAAAVSGLLCPIALGSDTGGSIRQPAALCGVTGFKPTYGGISRFGLVAFGSSLDQIGPLTRSVADTAMIMDVLAKHCEKDSTSIKLRPREYIHEIEGKISGGKIGVPWQFLDQLQGEARENFEKALEVYKDLGCEIVDVDLGMLKYGIAIYYIIATAEASTNLARFDGIRYGIRSKEANTLEDVYDLSREVGFGKEVKRRILLGTFVLSGGYKDAFYKKAQQVRMLIIRQMRKAFGKCDIIALPASSGPAFALDALLDPLDEYLQDLYTVGANLAGLPAISIPSGQSCENKPLGLQLLGPQTLDHHVLRFAYAFEKATDFSKKVPPGFGGSS